MVAHLILCPRMCISDGDYPGFRCGPEGVSGAPEKKSGVAMRTCRSYQKKIWGSDEVVQVIPESLNLNVVLHTNRSPNPN